MQCAGRVCKAVGSVVRDFGMRVQPACWWRAYWVPLPRRLFPHPYQRTGRYTMKSRTSRISRSHIVAMSCITFSRLFEEVGARPGARILPFGCSGTPGTSSTEPTRVELRYELPKPLAVTAPASVMATLSTVRLTPGHPAPLHPDDCQLVKDLTTTLLPSIGSHIESNHLNCAGVQGSSPGLQRDLASLEGGQHSSAKHPIDPDT